MNKKLKRKLVKVMDKFLEDICETKEYAEGDFYCPNNLTKNMANAAEIIYDQNKNTHDFLREDGQIV